RSKRRELLHRLVGWPILSKPDRVVREDPDRGDLHERAQADRLARIVREDQVCRPIRPELGKRKAVDGGGHPVLTNAEVEVATASLVGRERRGSLERQRDAGRACEIGGATDDPGHALCDGVERLSGRDPRRDPLLVRREGGDLAVPPLRELASLHRLDVTGKLRVLAAVSLEELLPLLSKGAPTRPDTGGEMLD